MSPLGLAKKKSLTEPIVVATAYDYAGGMAAATSGVDVILVGDSSEQVVHGRKSTASITLDLMLAHCAAVRRGITSGIDATRQEGNAG